MSKSKVAAQRLEQTKAKIREIAHEIVELSGQDLQPEEYFRAFLERIVFALAAHGGAAWLLGEDGQAQLVAHLNLPLAELEEGAEQHSALLGRVVKDNLPLVVPPYRTTEGEQRAANPTSSLLLLAPLHAHERVVGVVEIFQRPGDSASVQNGYRKFLTQMCELASDWAGTRLRRRDQGQHSLMEEFHQFALAAHQSHDRRETAYVVANEGRRILVCDRVSVALLHGRKVRLEAISGQDTFDRRSNTVRLLERLVRRVLVAGEPFWYTGQSREDLAPQIEHALEAYVDHTHAMTIGVLPLRSPDRQRRRARESDDESSADAGPVIGALVVERMDVDAAGTLAAGSNLLAQHASRALANAIDYQGLLLMPLWRTLGKARVLTEARNLPKTVGIAVLLVIFILVTLLVPIQFNLEGPAELQPVQRRDVFARIDGVITQVHVKHRDRVQRGDPLVSLRNTDLLVQIEDVEGRQAQLQKRLAAARRRLLDRTGTLPQERDEIAAEVLQLRRQQDSLAAQHKLLMEEKENLVVRSPLDGQVVTWDVEKLLANRPVTHGQVLLTVADPEGEWELLIHMPEDNAGYISAAQKEQGEDLAVNYILATNPGQKLRGKVKNVHQRAELHETDGQTVKIAVEIDKHDLTRPYPGATATAEVHCGERSIAFVWLHDVVEFVQSKLIF